MLTKPIGTGVIATAIKREAAHAAHVADAVSVMTTLNRAAAEAMLAGPVHAATDVTGFGLVGHLRAMLRASGVGAVLETTSVPLLAGAREYARAGHVPGGTRRNQSDAADVQWNDVDDVLRVLLCDAQTSGGLLIAVPEPAAEPLLERLRHAGTPAAARIGRVTEAEPGALRVQA